MRSILTDRRYVPLIPCEIVEIPPVAQLSPSLLRELDDVANKARKSRRTSAHSASLFASLSFSDLFCLVLASIVYYDAMYLLERSGSQLAHFTVVNSGRVIFVPTSLLTLKRPREGANLLLSLKYSIFEASHSLFFA